MAQDGDSVDDLLDGSRPALGSGAGWSTDGPRMAEGSPDAPHPFDAPEAARYVRRHTLGQGGMGRVVAVFDRRLEREVALKELRPAAADPSLGVRRLAQEARITAQLDHPGIVPILDAGRSPAGGLFYTMPIIRGRTLAAAMADATTLPARLALVPHVLAAAQAVAHAHQHAILHRDLKPTNILVGALGETQVVDWGLARALHDAGPESHPRVPTDGSMTAQGTVLGTPHYMSPEQANGLTLGPSSDVWSLGVILYELLTAERPFPGDSAQRVLAQVRRAAPRAAAQLVPDAPEDLLAIVTRALHHRPTDRYPDAHALAADLQRYLSGQQVQARTYPPAERLLRAAKAWKGPLIGIGTALVITIFISTVAWIQTIEERDRAQLAEQEARAALLEADRSLARALTLQAGQAAQQSSRAEAEILASHALVLAPNPHAWGVLMGLSGTPRPRRLHELPFETPCGSPVLPDGADFVLCGGVDGLQRIDLDTGTAVWRHPTQVRRFTPLAGGAEVFVIDTQRSTLVVDAGSGTVRSSSRYRESHTSVRPGPDAHTITVLDEQHLRLTHAVTLDTIDLPTCAEGGHTASTPIPGGGLLVMCDGGTWLELGPTHSVDGPAHTQHHPELRNASHVALSPHARRLAVTTRTGLVTVVDRSTGHVLHTHAIGLGELARSTWSPDGKRLMVHAISGPTVVLDTHTGSIVARLPASGARTGRFIDDQVVELVSTHGVVRWALPRGGIPHNVASGHGVTAVRVSPDGQTLLVCRGDGLLTLRSLPTTSQTHQVGHPDVVCKDADFFADSSAAIAGYARTDDILVVDVSSGETSRLQPARARRFRRVFTLQPDIAVGLSYAQVGPVAIHADGRDEGGLVVPSLRVWEGASSADHSHGVVVDTSGAVYRLNGGARPSVDALWSADTLYAAAITNDGTAVLVGTATGAEERTAATGAVVHRYTIGNTRAVDVVWSTDNQRLAIGDLAGAVWLFARGDSAPLAVLEGHRQKVSTLAFSPDDRTLFTGSWDGGVRAWDLSVRGQLPERLLAEAERDWGLTRAQVLGAAPSSR